MFDPLPTPSSFPAPARSLQGRPAPRVSDLYAPTPLHAERRSPAVPYYARVPRRLRGSYLP